MVPDTGNPEDVLPEALPPEGTEPSAGTQGEPGPADPGSDGDETGAGQEAEVTEGARDGADRDLGLAVISAVAASPILFPDAGAEIAKAGREIFLRQVSVRGLRLDALRSLHDAVGEAAFRAFVPGMRGGDLARLLAGVDPHKPGLSAMSPEQARIRVAEIAAGASPTAAADIATMDLAALRTARESMGDDFPAWLAALKGGESRKAAARLDPERPGIAAMDPEPARAHIGALANGLEPTLPVRIDEIDLAGLRTAREYLGEGFPAWIGALKQGEAKKALARIDPHRPGLAGLEMAGMRAHLKALSEETEPSAAIVLDELDLAGLGATRDAVGQEAFDAWLADLKPADAKKAVIRLDPDRPGVRKLRPEEYRDALASLAERMSPHSAGRTVPGVGEITFGQARHDEERFPDGTDEGGA